MKKKSLTLALFSLFTLNFLTSVSAQSQITDADGDTKVQTEHQD